MRIRNILMFTIIITANMIHYLASLPKNYVRELSWRK